MEPWGFEPYNVEFRAATISRVAGRERSSKTIMLRQPGVAFPTKTADWLEAISYCDGNDAACVRFRHGVPNLL
jgi:hypothetical protein